MGRRRRLPPTTALLLSLVLVALAAGGERSARAQTIAAPGYLIIPSGWNLISLASTSSLYLPSAADTLYTLQPGDSSYRVSGWQALTLGYGYWAEFDANTAVRLPPSSVDTYSVDVPAGTWVMVGNPSTSSSARVTGADRSLVYSPLTGYRDDTLLPVGYGAFVLSERGGRVTVSVSASDRPQVDYPSCCRVGGGSFGGKAHIDILDDSSYALLYGVRAVNSDGSMPAPVAGNYGYGEVAPCPSCSDYSAAPAGCRAAANMRTVEVTPGQYLIRLSTDGPLVPDIILVASLEANTRYYFCRWVAAGRA